MSIPDHIAGLVEVVLNNLENQHDWTELKTHSKPELARTLISGYPPRRLYVHPDEQIEIIKAEKNRAEPIPQPPEYEWVLPMHLEEKWTVGRFAAVFDSIEAIPPLTGVAADGKPAADQELEQWQRWRGAARGKRILLATVQDDSTVVYYLMHDGIVKPRQN
jgi:tRNA-splicing endonuclease subunit Sen15